MNAILASNLNMKCLKQKSIFSTPVFKVDNKLWTKVHVKPTNRQSYLHNKSEHPNSTKNSIAYSQVLGFNKICYNRTDLHSNCKRLLNTLTKRDAIKKILQNKSTVLFQFQETSYWTKLNHLILNAHHLLLRITGLYLTSEQSLTKILQIESKLKVIFAEPPLLVFKGNKNLKRHNRG